MSNFGNPTADQLDAVADLNCGRAAGTTILPARLSPTTPLATTLPRRHRGKAPETAGDIERRLGRLAATIELEVIPRLMLTHRTPRPGSTDVGAGAGPPIETIDVETLSRLALAGNLGGAKELVAGLQRRGAQLDTIYLELLAPTARRLGYLWEEDLHTFTEVTIGLSCLQQTLRHLSPSFADETAELVGAPRIILAPVAGEHHTFGIYIVEEFFRRAGWNVNGSCAGDSTYARGIVADESIDVVGLSAGGELVIDRLRSEIRGIREASVNKNIVIMVGGSLFNTQPQLVAEVGADCSAVDGKLAVVHASAAIAGSTMHG